MNLQIFLDSVSSLQAIPEEMLMHLKELAPRMTDEERSATLEKMQKIDAELVANIQSTANLSKEADEIMHTFEANVLRPMAKDAEAAERSSENSAADQLFN